MQITIDTSTDTAGLALTDNGQLVAELTWHCGMKHSVQLLPNLRHLLEQNGLTLEDADCIIVARGPGSYNGLRVGISTARGLAFGLGIPVIGMSTLEAEAWQHAETRLPICSLLNAGRDEVAAAVYRLDDSGWNQLQEEHLASVEDLCASITEKTLFCGEYVVKIQEEIQGIIPDKAVFLSPAANRRRPAFLAELGLKRMAAGDFDDTATLQPHYFRGPSITKPNPGKK